MERDIIRLECLKLAVANKGLYQVTDYIAAAKAFEEYVNASSISETVSVHADEPKRGRPKGSGKLRQEASSSIGGAGIHSSDEKHEYAPNGEKEGY